MPGRNHSIFTSILLWMFEGIYSMIKWDSCFSEVLRWMWVSHLLWTLPFLLPVLVCICKLILAFAVWIIFNSDFLLKYMKVTDRAVIRLRLPSCPWALCLVTPLCLLDFNCTNWVLLFMEIRKREELQKQWASFRKGRHFLVTKLSDPTALAKWIQAKPTYWQNNFIRVGMFGSVVEDKFRSWDFGCCGVWFKEFQCRARWIILVT